MFFEEESIAAGREEVDSKACYRIGFVEVGW